MPRRGSKARPKPHDATVYAREVVAGDIPASKWCRLACQRHLDDLKASKRKDYPWRFDEERANLAIRVFPLFSHFKGEWSGRPFILESWQRFIVGSLFGWVSKETGYRRFSVAYIEIPRKNGKTPLAAVIGLILLVFDGEPAAEVYFAATKRDQAKIAFDYAVNFAKKSRVAGRLNFYQYSVTMPGTLSSLKCIGADYNSQDGFELHGAVIDELHAHQNRRLWDVLTTADGARRESLVCAITTAGVDTNGICFEQRSYSEKILEGGLEDDTHFAYIATIDEDDGDDYEDPETWAKANPNLGVSCRVDKLRRDVTKAKASPAQAASIKRYRFNIWGQAENKLIDLKRWNLCDTPVDLEALEGLPFFGGLDLASSSDFNAFSMLFPPTEDFPLYRVACRFWIPEAAIKDRTSRGVRVPIAHWVEEGWVTMHDGDEVDHRAIGDDIEKDCERFEHKTIGFDPWNSHQLGQDLLAAGLRLVKVRPGYANENGPTKELLSLIKRVGIVLGANPVLKWMASNTVAKESREEGYIRPSKEKSREKIDGISALVTALGRAMVGTDEDDEWPYDEEEGLTILG